MTQIRLCPGHTAVGVIFWIALSVGKGARGTFIRKQAARGFKSHKSAIYQALPFREVGLQTPFPMPSPNKPQTLRDQPVSKGGLGCLYDYMTIIHLVLVLVRFAFQLLI